MTLKEARREFKKHYRRANKLKEGGKAWEREITLTCKYKDIAMKLYQAEQKARYNG